VSFLKIFRRPPPIRDAGGLALFIDERAAFVVQKGIFEYSRARAGHFSKVMFREAAFQEAIERSRWLAYPLGLAMVGELAEGVLRPHCTTDPAKQREGLHALVLGIIDGYPTPQVLSPQEWAGARAELERRLQLIGSGPPKRSFDIPAPFARDYADLMPIHPDLRQSELPTLHNYLMAMLCNFHDELSARMDALAVVRSLVPDPH
jgi:hypothetical protein